VFHGEDQMKVVVVFDDHPRTHLGCWNCHVLNSLLETHYWIDGSCLVLAGNGEPDGRSPCFRARRQTNLKFYLKHARACSMLVLKGVHPSFECMFLREFLTWDSDRGSETRVSHNVTECPIAATHVSLLLAPPIHNPLVINNLLET
jgi:hypothetical protein